MILFLKISLLKVKKKSFVTQSNHLLFFLVKHCTTSDIVDVSSGVSVLAGGWWSVDDVLDSFIATPENNPWSGIVFSRLFVIPALSRRDRVMKKETRDLLLQHDFRLKRLVKSSTLTSGWYFFLYSFILRFSMVSGQFRWWWWI